MTPRERLKAAYLQLICGVNTEHLRVAFEASRGELHETIEAIWYAANHPGEVSALADSTLYGPQPPEDEKADDRPNGEDVITRAIPVGRPEGRHT